ncbi:AAEL015649-PA [Aedes aegypti]|uniref:AAEL015649-PA n=1 Tax=Aedes aegypti TaxID=7159 RepID=Q1DGF9_AEDAE|nr:AAEL015649-PA [Aedes aegypti]
MSIRFSHLSADFRIIRTLQLTEIVVPDVVDVRDTPTLSCSYDMGTHTLNSVKWYKDESEFFRYSPMLEPNVRTFPVDGVSVVRDSPEHYCNRFMCSIQLQRLNIKSSGTYRCEVSGDAPEFKLAHGVYNMMVAEHLPDILYRPVQRPHLNPLFTLSETRHRNPSVTERQKRNRTARHTILIFKLFKFTENHNQFKFIPLNRFSSDGLSPNKEIPLPYLAVQEAGSRGKAVRGAIIFIASSSPDLWDGPKNGKI